jgi:hypothetical protein
MFSNSFSWFWFQRITQLLPDERVTRQRNLAALISGIAQSRSVWLSEIAAALPGTALALSLTRRLDRFLENPAFRVRDWYEPLARHLLIEPHGHPLRLIIDASKVGFHKQLLLVALAYRHRTLPLAWDWVAHGRGHSPAAQQLRLLEYVRTLLPPGAKVILVGDAEFGASDVLTQLEAWGWQYVLRQKGKVLVRPEVYGTWQPFGTLVQRAGESLWHHRWQVTQQHAHLTNVVAHWAIGEREPWLLVTNLPSLRQAVYSYTRRMWIEETFGDLKRHGFDLESTHLQDPEKLSRLTFAVVLLYLSLLTLCTPVLKPQVRRLVDHAQRRDLSVFRLGWRMLRRCVANGLPFAIEFNPFVT